MVTLTGFLAPIGALPPGHTPYSWGESRAASSASHAAGAGAGAPSSSDAPCSAQSALARTEGFLQRLAVKNILKGDKLLVGSVVKAAGWARTVRFAEKNAIAFIELYDGSCFGSVQVVAHSDKTAGWADLEANSVTGTCFLVEGEIKDSPAEGQSIELHASTVRVLGPCPGADYPLAKGRLPLEHLRTVAHLRPRSNTIGAMMRIRNVLAYAIHEFFQKREFYYVHAPLITSSDCEGAGEMFQVTTLLDDKVSKIPLTPEGNVDYSKDFFSAPTFLTVSGQLEGEAYACAMSKIYTFGPTFRAEVSHTPRHLAEFWMIEPEVAFANLDDVMDLGEAFLKHCCAAVLDKCQEDLVFFEKTAAFAAPKAGGKGGAAAGAAAAAAAAAAAPSVPLRERLREVVEKEFRRIPYKEAVAALIAADRKWEFPPKMGEDLATEHEKYITDVLVGGPAFVTNWPKGIKSFYMRLNDDNETVAAVDCLLPKVGEIIGGSQREERLDVLRSRMAELGVAESHLNWYLDLRRFGSCPHGGFGLGFERLVLFCTGIDNIRDAIPFPRYPGHAEF